MTRRNSPFPFFPRRVRLKPLNLQKGMKQTRTGQNSLLGSLFRSFLKVHAAPSLKCTNCSSTKACDPFCRAGLLYCRRKFFSGRFTSSFHVAKFSIVSTSCSRACALNPARYAANAFLSFDTTALITPMVDEEAIFSSRDVSLQAE